MRRFLILLTIVALAVMAAPVPAPSDGREGAQHLYNEAIRLHDQAVSAGDLAQAEQKYLGAFRLFKELDDHGKMADVWVSLGSLYDDQGQHDKAEEHYKQSLAIKRELNDRGGEGRILNALGLVNWHWGKYDEAEKLYEQALAISREVQDRRLEGHAINNLGLLYKDWGQLDKALEMFGQSLAISREVENRRSESIALNNIALIYCDWGQYEKALEHYEQALAIKREVRDRQGEALALHNMGWTYTCWGHYDRALAYYEQALPIQKHLKDLSGEGLTLHNVGWVHFNQGQYGKALEYYEQSFAIRNRLKDRRAQGKLLNDVGLVYASWGQYDKAVEYYEKSLAIKRDMKDPHGASQTLNNLGLLYADWGQYDKAVDYYEQSLAVKKELKDPMGEGKSVINLGTVHRARGDRERALECFQRGLAIFKEIKRPVDYPENQIAQLYLDGRELEKAEEYLKKSGWRGSWGRYYLLKSRYDMARDTFLKVLAYAEKNRDVDSLFTAYTGLGLAYEGLEDYKTAEEFYAKGMKLVEEMRASLLPAERTNFLDVRVNGFSRSEPAHGLTRVRMKLNLAAGSIDSSEVTRARAFADKLALRAQGEVAGLPEDRAQTEEELVIRVASLRKTMNKISKEADPKSYAAAETNVHAAEAALDGFVAGLRKEHPAYAAVKYPQPVPLKESAIRDNEYVVMFDVLGDGVGVKLIRGKKIVRTAYLDWRHEDLEKDVEKLLAGIDIRNLRGFDARLAKDLYENLFSGILASLPKDAPFVIIPDGILARLPFEALVVEGAPVWKEHDGIPYPEGLTYLGDVHPISYYQSITALTLARDAPKPAHEAHRVLVIADPVFDRKDARYAPAAQTRVAQAPSPVTVALMSASEMGPIRFDRLVETGKLAESLKELDPAGTDVLTGLDATKAMLVDKPLTDYRHIVFATHGYFGKDIPRVQEPILALTLVDQPQDKDGLLRMSEVMNLKLNADVVALTACQTGVGQHLSGEGTMNMGRAFQYAGARSVLMTLWSVAESSSVNLVEGFFRELKGGKDRLQALRLARREIRKEGFEHPFFWAAFILAGEADGSQ